jgi:uncharacterized protein with HEPN domain
MRRDPRAFLSDVMEAGSAILEAVRSIDFESYSENRLIRSSVEQEFTIIGEALSQLSQRDKELFDQINQATQIISFRNKLTHEYLKVNNLLVWGVIENDLPALIEQCSTILRTVNAAK